MDINLSVATEKSNMQWWINNYNQETKSVST